MDNSVCNMANKDYLSVRVPRRLMKEVDGIVGLRVLGFRSRAEFVVDAIRGRLEVPSELERIQAKLR